MLKTHFNFWGLKSEIFESIVQNLHKITAPTLIIWGKQDQVIPVKHAHIAADLLPHNRLHIFDRCGHWAQVEYALEFNQLTLEFLQSRIS
jgi:4,5:9,10-diseco-3-hydroxy-5,9,17-trioxoandrosta-1(10),2-diene-4-oate hydrolase